MKVFKSVPHFPKSDEKHPTTTGTHSLILVVSNIVTVFTLAWIFSYMRYGIDLTDEGFYLVSISNPFNYSATLTQFGFIYYPLYEAFNGDIVALRWGNVLITIFLAFILSVTFLKKVISPLGRELTRWLIIAGTISTSSLIYLGLMPPTPSYNTLAFQSMLLAAIGLIQTDNSASVKSVFGWLILGIGCSLCFMAKPSTSGIVSIWSVVFLLAAGKFNLRLFFIALITSAGFIVLIAYIIDGSIFGFFDRLRAGFQTSDLLNGGTTIKRLFRLDNFVFRPRSKFIFVLLTVTTLLSILLALGKNLPARCCYSLILIGFGISSLAVIFGYFLTRELMDDDFRGMLVCSLLVASVLATLALYRFKGIIKAKIFHSGLTLTFLVFPFLYAFGTGNNYWLTATQAGFFWILSSIGMLGPLAPKQKSMALFLPLALAGQFITVVVIQNGFEAPYRQPQPLSKNDYKIEIGNPKSLLVISGGFGRYIDSVIRGAREAGFQKGTPMIDLTGQSPGILHALAAKSLGQAWTVGGYPGSDKRAIVMLRRERCEHLASSWLLLAPDGPRRISTQQILMSFGAKLADYEVVACFETPEKSGMHHLLRPVRTPVDAVRSCNRLRLECQP
jgi:hypothetical protein